MIISPLEVLIVSFLAPIGTVFWTYIFVKLLSKFASYQIRGWVTEKVLG